MLLKPAPEVITLMNQEPKIYLKVAAILALVFVIGGIFGYAITTASLQGSKQALADAVAKASKDALKEPVTITSPVGGCQWQVLPSGAVIPVFVDSSRTQLCNDTAEAASRK